MTPMLTTAGNSEPYYDLNDDWALIVASFQSEYGIRLSRDLDGMKWAEFSSYINGLGSETPLGRIVSIRAEDRAEVLKDFTPEQRRIRNEYRQKLANKKSSKEVDTALENIKKAFIEWK
jgi:hypothetical protein